MYLNLNTFLKNILIKNHHLYEKEIKEISYIIIIIVNIKVLHRKYLMKKVFRLIKILILRMKCL